MVLSLVMCQLLVAKDQVSDLKTHNSHRQVGLQTLQFSFPSLADQHPNLEAVQLQMLGLLGPGALGICILNKPLHARLGNHFSSPCTSPRQGNGGPKKEVPCHSVTPTAWKRGGDQKVDL